MIYVGVITCLLFLGAMENWGLVTYRERILLVDPVNTSQATKQYVALVVGEWRVCIIWNMLLYRLQCQGAKSLI